MNTLYYNVYVPSISARLSDDDLNELEAVSELVDEDKSTVIRKALTQGLSSIRRRVAIERYQSGEISVNGAARLAGVSLAEWLKIARELGATVTGTVGVVVRAVEDGLDREEAHTLVRQIDSHGLHMTGSLRETAAELIDKAARSIS